MKGKTLILAIAAAIAAPVATAGVDRGIGIPASRDSVVPAAPLVSEKAAGLWQAPQQSSAPLVSEKTAGLFPGPESSATLVSEKTAGLFPAPTPSTPVLAAADGGFDWNDAALGAGATLAFLLAASTGAFAVRRRGAVAHY